MKTHRLRSRYPLSTDQIRLGFAKFQTDYSAERSDIVAKTAILEAEIEELQGKMANVQSFMELAENYGDVTELTADVARRFIDKIVVHEAVIEEDIARGKLNGRYRQKRIQEVRVFINCIDEFVPK